MMPVLRTDGREHAEDVASAGATVPLQFCGFAFADWSKGLNPERALLILAKTYSAQLLLLCFDLSK